MSGEFPEPDTSYYVCETTRLASGTSVTDLVAGPFEFPDQARQARDAMHRAEPRRELHCSEYTIFE